ncbi:extracellular solute-binding protein [Demequina maris]|uniref:extracellular solute-binding protein n=1 Tax=Demequina maris TaxID=1638982 RepID=UPI0007821CBD|nr:extracellular solute-binding protein [Demequina maris]
MTVSLTGITWEHERGFGSMASAARAYVDVQPEVRVTWEQRSLQSFADQPLEELVERYDLLVIDHPHIPHAAEAGLLAPLDGTGHDAELASLAERSVGRSHESYQHAGRQWALASDAAAQVAAYRPDLLPTPPQTWPEVVDLAREGHVVWPYKPVDAYSSLITVAAGLGEEAIREPGVFLSRRTLGAALEILRELARYVPADNRSWNPIEAADALSTSDRYAYCPLLFGYTNYSREGFRPHRLKFVDIPLSRRGYSGSLLGGAGIAVSARSSHMSEAVDHAFWVASGPVQESAYYDGGGQPGHADAWDSDRTNADSLDFFRGTRQTLEGAYLRPRAPRYIELQNTVAPWVTDAIATEADVEELAQRLDAAVTMYLED